MGMSTDSDGLKERFQEIAAVDAAAAFDPYDPDQINPLRAYARICTDLNRRLLLREPVRFDFSAGVDGEGERLQHAGEEALRSAMVDFRLLWMDREPTSFSRLRNVVRGRAKSDLDAGREALNVIDALGKDFSEARREEVLGGEDPETGKIYMVTRAAALIDDWLNGVAFHQDPKRAARVGEWSRETYEYMLIRSVNRVANVCFAFAVLVDLILAAQDTDEG